KSLRKQIRVRGPVARVSDAEADAYFATRPKDSQIGAWASAQSRPMEGRFVFEREVAKYAAKYALTKVPRPPYWSGFRVSPLENEFWRDRPFRPHDRLVYRRDDANAPWHTLRLFP
ncbi:MAG: pyridoxal 5'-phosphate synthase, partial [Alphaproteobacteria bacterium]|nr:pyridoxal 5'-phosphate synthase [Alphaproteobacteria bacterium]